MAETSEQTATDAEQQPVQPGEQAAPHHHHRHHHHHRNKFLRSILKIISSAIADMKYFPIFLCLFIVGAMPIMYNGGEDWWVPTVLTLTLTAAGFWGLTAKNAKQPSSVNYVIGSLIILIPLVLGAIQLIPSNFIVKCIAPRVWSQWQYFNTLDLGEMTARLTLAPSNTRSQVLVLLACLVLYLMLLTKCRHRLYLRLLMLSIVIAALGNALLSYASFITSKGGMSQLHVFTGAFLSRNHFGFLMMIGTMTCIGLMCICNASKDITRSNSSLNKMVLPLGFIAFLLIVAQILSLSRGAFIALAIALLTFGTIWILKSHEFKRTKRQQLLAMLVLVIGALMLALPFAMDALAKRYKELLQSDLTMNDRYIFWVQTIKMIKDYPTTGCGLGGYADAVQEYAPAFADKARLGHAHNDYLEFFADMGIPAGLFFFGLIACLMYIAFKRCWHQTDSTYRWAGLSALSAMIGVGVHELVEFNLHAWSNLIVVTSLMAIISISCGKRHEHNHPDARRTEQNVKSLWHRALPVALGILLLFFAVPLSAKYTISAYNAYQLYEKMEVVTSAWKPGKANFNRRLILANSALKYNRGNQNVLRQKAILEAEFAEYRLYNSRETKALWAAACKNIRLACQNAPLNSKNLHACALIHELAMKNNAVLYDGNKVMRLYNALSKAAPTIQVFITKAAHASYRHFLHSLTADPQNAEKNKAIAIERMLHLMQIKSIYSPDFFAKLNWMLSGYDEILANTPDDFITQSTLLAHLLSRNQLKLAHDLTEKMLACLENSPKNKEYSERKQRVKSAQGLIYELSGDTQKGLAEFKEIIRSASEANELPKWDTSQADNEDKIHKAEQSLLKIRRKYPLSTQNVLSESRLYAYLGQSNEAIHALLPIAYMEYRTLPMDYLLEVKEMLDNELGGFSPYTTIRANFLKAAVDILIAQQNPEMKLHRAEALLELLEKEFESTTEERWLQAHLIPYYLGKLRLLQNRNSDAILEFKKCLELCPNHLWSMRQLQKLDASSLEPRELELLELIAKRPYPIALCDNGMLWRTCCSEPEEITDMHTKTTLTFIFEAIGDVRDTNKIPVFITDIRGQTFADKLYFSTGQALTLKAGELLLMTLELQPNLDFLKQVHKIMTPGQTKISLGTIAYPSPTIKGFTVRN